MAWLLKVGNNWLSWHGDSGKNNNNATEIKGLSETGINPRSAGAITTEMGISAPATWGGCCKRASLVSARALAGRWGDLGCQRCLKAGAAAPPPGPELKHFNSFADGGSYRIQLPWTPSLLFTTRPGQMRKTERAVNMLGSFLRFCSCPGFCPWALRCSWPGGLKTLGEVGLEKLTVKSLRSRGLGNWGQLKPLRRVPGVVWEAGKVRSVRVLPKGCRELVAKWEVAPRA